MAPAKNAPPYPRRILCATDFSPSSGLALERAVALARPAGAEIVVLHVAPFPMPTFDSDDEPDWMPPGPGERGETLERMRRFAEPAEAAGLPTRLLLREGIPSDEILRAAAQLEPDLIAMGTHGRRGLHRLLGSHAARVLQQAPCAVLTATLADADAPAGVKVPPFVPPPVP